MAALESFSNRLKSLRGKISVKQLATDSGVAQTAIYKAEGGEHPVAWKTVEKAYGTLCSDQQYVELLMLWALTQSSRRIGLYAANESMSRVMDEERTKLGESQQEVLSATASMTDEERRELARFARHYARSEPTRRMSRAWMEALDVQG